MSAAQMHIKMSNAKNTGTRDYRIVKLALCSQDVNKARKDATKWLMDLSSPCCDVACKRSNSPIECHFRLPIFTYSAAICHFWLLEMSCKCLERSLALVPFAPSPRLILPVSYCEAHRHRGSCFSQAVTNVRITWQGNLENPAFTCLVLWMCGHRKVFGQAVYRRQLEPERTSASTARMRHTYIGKAMTERIGFQSERGTWCKCAQPGATNGPCQRHEPGAQRGHWEAEVTTRVVTFILQPYVPKILTEFLHSKSSLSGFGMTSSTCLDSNSEQRSVWRWSGRHQVGFSPAQCIASGATWIDECFARMQDQDCTVWTWKKN